MNYWILHFILLFFINKYFRRDVVFHICACFTYCFVMCDFKLINEIENGE